MNAKPKIATVRRLLHMLEEADDLGDLGDDDADDLMWYSHEELKGVIVALRWVTGEGWSELMANVTETAMNRLEHVEENGDDR